MLFACVSLTAQNEEKKEKSPEQKMLEESFRRAAIKYQSALRYNDVDVAKDAVYEMLAINPRATNMLDTLAFFYFENRQYTSAFLVSKDAISINADNVNMLEINAICLENLGARDRALEQYESLYIKTDDLGVLYKMAVIQFELNRFNESKTSAELLIESKSTDELMLSFPKADNSSQNISMRAAAYTLLGMIHQKRGKTAEAKEAFNKSLEMFPDFEYAKENLQSLGN